jgi:hypothetical protein
MSQLCNLVRVEGSVVATGMGLCCESVRSIFSIANVSGNIDVRLCDNLCPTEKGNNISCTCRTTQNICQNDGVCTSRAQPRGFTCACGYGYFGSICSQGRNIKTCTLHTPTYHDASQTSVSTELI